MKINPFSLGVIFSICCVQFVFAQQESHFELISERITEEYQSSPNLELLDKQIVDLQSEISADGHWGDIDYASKSMTGWKPDMHIKRLGTLVKGYSRPKSIFYKNSKLYQNILNAMSYWTGLSPAPTSDNWWWLSISVPKEIGGLLIAMRTMERGVPKDLEDAMITWMNKHVSITKAPGSDGSNLTDIAQHMIMQAVLTKDAALLKNAISATAGTIKISKGEGIQRDMSFHAHGPSLYSHGYGREYILGIRNVAVYVNGTSFAFSPEQMAILSDFVRNGYIPAIRGKYIDYNVIGRGIARSNATRTNSGLIIQIKAIDIPEHAEEYQNAIDRIDEKKGSTHGIKPRNIYYWRSDYSLHQRPEFSATVHIASSRTKRTESGNGENLTGQYLTEGAMNIVVKGDEYYNIFPNWDWTKIPGSTLPENKELKKRTNWVSEMGNADFAGGVSDGLNGVSVYQMDAYNTQAHKAWFFFGDKIICLGAGINANRGENINTTLNQSRLRAGVWVAEKDDFKQLKSNYEKFSKGLSWIYHDGVGYYFPEQQKVMLSAQEQPGSWAEINKNSSDKPVKQSVFKLWVNHGIRPKNASYSYILLPGIESVESLKNQDASDIRILSNSTSVQAVEDQKANLLGFVFYKKGGFKWEQNKLTVSQAVLVQLQEVSKGIWNVSLSDPTQKLTGSVNIKLELNGTEKSMEFKLPGEDLAGSSVSKRIEF